MARQDKARHTVQDKTGQDKTNTRQAKSQTQDKPNLSLYQEREREREERAPRQTTPEQS
jgi:hypothetical protein